MAETVLPEKCDFNLKPTGTPGEGCDKGKAIVENNSVNKVIKERTVT